MFERSLRQNLEKDLTQKMVLLAGPRQCGKTTLAKHLLKKQDGAYYNWDIDADRKRLLNSQMDEARKLWVFDELHKFRRWRNWLKGQFDLHHPKHRILVTGSARLDAYSRGGDSLQGRYFFHRLHPVTFSEYLGLKPLSHSTKIPALSRSSKDLPSKALDNALGDLLQRSGFPEPLFASSQQQADRWRLSYGTRLVREDIQSLESLKDLDRLELLYDRLPLTVGSVLSINSLREDLEVAFETVRNWLTIFERTYAIFRVSPFGAPRIKAVKKEQKLYLWDWAKVDSEAARFENLIGSHLLRLTHWCEDIEGKKTELRYFRDVSGHEVDFIVLRDQKPWMAVEVKTEDRPLDSNLKYFLERVKVPHAFQISLKGTKDWRHPDINGCEVRILPATRFLSSLP